MSELSLLIANCPPKINLQGSERYSTGLIQNAYFVENSISIEKENNKFNKFAKKSSTRRYDTQSSLLYQNGDPETPKQMSRPLRISRKKYFQMKNPTAKLRHEVEFLASNHNKIDQKISKELQDMKITILQKYHKETRMEIQIAGLRKEVNQSKKDINFLITFIKERSVKFTEPQRKARPHSPRTQLSNPNEISQQLSITKDLKKAKRTKKQILYNLNE